MSEFAPFSFIHNTLTALMQIIDVKDNYTFIHCKEVGNLCREFSKFLKMDKKFIDRIEMAGLIHDVGKIFIEEDILLKNTSLSEEEYMKIKKHSEIGAELISRVDGLQCLSRIILYHHERWDGQGYPCCLKKEEIPLESRILSICDAYHAMSSDRPYRKALSEEKIMSILSEEAEKQFDPQLLKIFLNFIKQKRNKNSLYISFRGKVYT